MKYLNLMPNPNGTIQQPPVLFPNTYVWLVFLSAMDIIMTRVVLFWGGEEVNYLADAVLNRFNLTGMVLFKFALVTLVITICEIVGRRNLRAAQRLARASVVITCIPVTLAFLQLLLFGHATPPTGAL